ncbi:hypothetical protein D3C77_585900 [compost metagenome]
MQVDVVRLDVRPTAVVATAFVVLLELVIDVARDFKFGFLDPLTDHRPRDDFVHRLHYRLNLSADEVRRTDLFGRQVLVYLEIQIPKLGLILCR